MTSSSPNPTDANQPANDRSSGSSHLSSSRPQQHVWGQSTSHQQPSRRGLTPLSTSLNNSAARSNTSSQSPRNPWSPPPAAANPSALPPSSARHASRSSTSISSPPSPYSPPASGSQPPYPTQVLQSGRSRTIASSSNPQFASSSSAASQGSGIGGSSGGGGASRLSRASPSISQSGFGTPSSVTSPSGQQVSKIITTQIFLLISTLKEDSAKWELQAEQIRKLVDSHGMEVFTKYFSRLVYTNKAQIWGQSRGTESSGSYQILVSEMQKVTRDPQQALKIAESIDTNEGDLLKEFELSTFLDHFRMDPIAKTIMALAFRKATKSDLRSKADNILSSNLQQFLHALANPIPEGGLAFGDEYAPAFLATIIDRIAQDPPRGWSTELQQQLSLAVQRRYLGSGNPVPAEIVSALFLFELLSPQNPLVRLAQRTGPYGTESLDACRTMLQSADPRDIGFQQVASTILFMTIARTEPLYDLKVFINALRDHRSGTRIDWQEVLHAFDRESVRVTADQFLTLYKALLPIAQEDEGFDLQLLWGGEWHHAEAQLSFVSSFLSQKPEELDASQVPRLRKSFQLDDFADAPDEAKSYAEQSIRHPFVSFDAAKALFNLVFRSNETYQHAQGLGIIENVINKNMDLFVCSVSAVPKPWGALQEQAMRQLVQSFLLKSFENHTFVFHILTKRDRTWLFSRLHNFYQLDPTRLYHIFDRAQDHGWLNDLIAMNNELSLDLVAYAHGRKLFELEAWLHQTSQSIPGPGFVKVLVQFLNTKAEDDVAVHREGVSPTTVRLTVRTVHALLGFLGERVGEGLQEDELVQVQRYSIQAYPRLINYGEGYDDIIDANGEEGNALPAEADARMQEHYKRMYSNESGVRDIITTLQEYKTSREPHMQELFACMIFGLFDEYSCFGDYPLDALAVTAVLFGSIINYKLLGRTALQCAIAMVLEAVRDRDPETSMYKFGLQSLIQFQERLHDWPTLCDRLVNVPGLQGTDPYKTAQEVLSKHHGIQMKGDSPNGAGVTSDNVDGFLAPSSKYPNFTCLSVDPQTRLEFYEDPEEQVQEAILFILNNVSRTNLETKIKDLKNELNERHFQWFANYIVEERAKMQANHQSLYMDLLSILNSKVLWAEVLRETYISVITMLNADSTMASSAERANLKNLGTWLGAMTLARNKAIKFKNISFKDLLIEAHDTERLIVVIPFICKVLAQVMESLIFKPPNAWTMEIVSILVELYHHAELKLNMKFEIEVLCKTLNLDHKTIQPSQVIRVRPQEEDEILSTAMPDGMEGFGDFSLMGLNRNRTTNERFSPSVILPELSELPSLLKHNYAQPAHPVGSMAAQNRLKQVLDTATQQAVQEIISPVVERSVTIAAISTSQLVGKDFALEPDESRFRDSAHTTVKSLAGSLALVTCKEPLRASMTNNIRSLAREMEHQPIPEGLILMFVNDNLETVCSFVERAAEHASIGEIDVQIEEAIRMRKNQNYREPPVSRWAYFVPDPYKPAPGGLNRDQMVIYEDFGRSVRGSAQHTLSASQDSASRQLPDVLQDAFGSVPNIPTPADAPAIPRQNNPAVNALHPTMSQHSVNGYGDEYSLADRISDIISELRHALDDIEGTRFDAAKHSNLARHAIDRLRGLLELNVSMPQVENICNAAAQDIAKMIFVESPGVAAAEGLVQVLQQLTVWSESVNYRVQAWMSEWNDDRLSEVQVTIALLKHKMMDPEQVDTILATSIRNQKANSLEVFKALIENLVVSDPPYALRSDFAHSTTALTHWLSEEPGIPLGEAIFDRLREVVNVGSPNEEQTPLKRAQADYILEEFINLKNKPDSEEMISSFIWQLYKSGTLGDRESSLTFFRNCFISAITGPRRDDDVYSEYPEYLFPNIDGLAALIVTVAASRGQQNGESKSEKAEYFCSILGIAVLVFIQHYQTSGEGFNSRVFFRLLSGVLCQIQETSRLSTTEQTEFLIGFAKCLLALQPIHFPAFAFSWLAILSHRILLPGLLNLHNEGVSGTLISFDAAALLTSTKKGWKSYVSLLQKQLSYLGENMKHTTIENCSKELYRGTLKLLVVLRQDFPDFLSENCFQFVYRIPLHCVQMRNLILSTSPAAVKELPDPFTEGLKLERLEDMRKNPVVTQDMHATLSNAGILDQIEQVLNGSDTEEQVIETIASSIIKAERSRGLADVGLYDSRILNSLMLYIAKNSESSSAQGTPSFLVTASITKAMEALASKLDWPTRQLYFHAVANQLRYPNSYTHYFSLLLLHHFQSAPTPQDKLEGQKMITRVLLERSMGARPHPWGLNMTFVELLNNRNLRFWESEFIKIPGLEQLLAGMFQQMGMSSRPMP